MIPSLGSQSLVPVLGTPFSVQTDSVFFRNPGLHQGLFLDPTALALI